jgi:hypothetical protein
MHARHGPLAWLRFWGLVALCWAIVISYRTWLWIEAHV